MTWKWVLVSSLLSANCSLMGQSVKQWAILINELLPDPSPAVGLPVSEFIELKNASDSDINLRNWKITDGSSTAIINTSIILPKDSFLILCPNTAVSSFQAFGNTLGLSNFPSLNNDADVISLYSSEGKLIHSIGYTTEWFQNSSKGEGGWSLEMIDPANPCAAFSNWKASENSKGGTPGKQNSVAGINKDEELPALMRTYTLDSLRMVVVFDESIDTSSLQVNRFSIDQHTIVDARAIGPLNKEVRITVDKPLLKNESITVSVNNITDCAGNSIGQLNKAKGGLPSSADTMDIIINEILYNPISDGYDYIEVFNRSKKIIDLKELVLANKASTGTLSNQVALHSTGFLVFPGDHLAFTENRKWVSQQYSVKHPETLLELNDFISLPDDKGHFVLLSNAGKTIDEISYDQKWHFSLLSDREGVSLERINANRPTQDAENWTSATADAGYGTPGYQNSQYLSTARVNGSVSVEPKVFSPDYDGRDDFTFIRYQLDQPGYMATVTIHDSYGRLVKTLVFNQSISSQGQWRWDGLDDSSYPLGAGIYIIVTELFDLKGRRKKFKTPVILAKPIR